MTKAGPPKEPVVTFVDNPHAPEVFATEVSGFLIQNGNVHLTFAANRVNHITTPGPVNRVVIARLVLPVSAAQGLAAGLFDFLKTHGYDPVPKPSEENMH